MTLGIAARGPKAGQAVFAALRAVERVAWGAIGGFAAFAAIGEDGALHEVGTQRGGSATLFTDGERTGAEPPRDVAGATLAALMSSGPDRPEPLSQFVAAEASAGLVTGHRLPNRAGRSGEALNREVLGRMRAGASAQAATDAVLDANPEADAGIIALDARGGLYARNSERVARRPDLGHARREDADRGAAVEVLHNAIFPGAALAAVAAEVALATMVPSWRPDGWISVAAGTVVELGAENAVLVGDDLVARKVLTTDEALLHGRQNGAAIYLGAVVRQGGRVLGSTVDEPNVVLEDGRIVAMSGQRRLRLGYRAR